MTDYIKKRHTFIFTGRMGCGKTHLVLGLIENEYKKYFDYIIFICPTLRDNATYLSRNLVKNDNQIWLVEPGDRLYEWIQKLLQLLRRLKVLFISDDLIADECLDKKRQSLLDHQKTSKSLSLGINTVLYCNSKEFKASFQSYFCLVSKRKGRTQDNKR